MFFVSIKFKHIVLVKNIYAAYTYSMCIIVIIIFSYIILLVKIHLHRRDRYTLSLVTTCTRTDIIYICKPHTKKKKNYTKLC